MSDSVKREIPILIVFVISMLMIIPFFIDIPSLSSAGSEVQRMLVPIASFGLVLGGLELTMRHVKIISNKREKWTFSVVLLFTFVLLFVLTLTPSLDWLYTTIYITIIGRVNETVFSLIALFMGTMAYRAFQMKNAETALFGLSCLVVLVANAPIGAAVWGGAPIIGKWIMNIPNMAAMRAINICVALGIFAYGIRVMLGHERIALGDVEVKKRGEDQG